MQALTNVFKKVTSALTPTKKNNSVTPAAAPSAAFKLSSPPTTFATTAPSSPKKDPEAFNTSQKGGRRKTRKSKRPPAKDVAHVDVKIEVVCFKVACRNRCQQVLRKNTLIQILQCEILVDLL